MKRLKGCNSLSFWNAFSAISVGLLAAVAGVVATILYECRKNPWLWIVIAIGVAIAVVLAILQRGKSSTKWGTAYYLGMLLANMRDEHQLKFRKFKKENHYQDTRAVTSKLEKHNNYGFDWVAEITATAQRMQESMNEDDVSTGFDICPNLLMPAALGIGAQLYFPHDVKYIEIPTDSGAPIEDDGSGTQKYVELDREVIFFDKTGQNGQFIFNRTSGLRSRRASSTKSESTAIAPNKGKHQAKEEVSVRDWPKWELPEFDSLLEEIRKQRERVFGSKDDEMPIERESGKNESGEDTAVVACDDTDNSPFKLCATHRYDDGALLITLEMSNSPNSRLAPLDGLKVHSTFSMEPKPIYNRVIMVGDKKRTPKWLIDLLEEEHRIKADNSSKVDESSKAEVTENQLERLRKKTALVTGEVVLRDSLALLEAAEQYYYDNQLQAQETPMVLMMRMPKTITITIGQMLDLLNEKYRLGKRRIPSYWENLIVMNWEPNVWRVTRVHPAQKSLKEMHDILLKHGYEVPS